MKVVIAANGPTLDSPVAKRFGHAPYYLYVDSETGQAQAINNTDPHDETHAIIPNMVGLGVEVFVTGNIGPEAFRLTQSFKRQVALARQMSAGQALDRLQRGELEILNAPTLKRSIHDHAHHDHNHHHHHHHHHSS
jgi:predicted Fe-Mo cluster-binding NifX family protein